MLSADVVAAKQQRTNKRLAVRQNVVVARGLGKRYLAYSNPSSRLFAALGLPAIASEYWALKDIDVEIPRGSCVGVVGDNGAGKSTLLKLLAGVVSPSHGSLHVNGRVTAILELGAGFHPEFTGRENLRFGGQLMGFLVDEIASLEPEIEEFSELGVALDRPLKTYSSGMVVRLAFSLVTAIQPDLLIVDEALAVGDQHFQKKCINRIERFRANGCTVLFCSHSLYHIRQLCDSALWLANGSAMAYGATETVLMRYEAHLRTLEQDQSPQTGAVLQVVPGNGGTGNTAAKVNGENLACLVSAQVHELEAAPVTDGGVPRLKGPDLRVNLTAIGRGDEMPSFGVMLEQVAGVGVTSVATHAEGVAPELHIQADGTRLWTIALTFIALPLHSGEYTLSFYLFDGKGLVVYDEWLKHTSFSLISPSLTPGLVRLPHCWS